MSGQWRVGNHYAIHVYEGDVPVCTALTVAYAKQIVADHNAALRPRAALAAGGGADRAAVIEECARAAEECLINPADSSLSKWGNIRLGLAISAIRALADHGGAVRSSQEASEQ